jgi:hypothetical protein
MVCEAREGVEGWRGMDCGRRHDYRQKMVVAENRGVLCPRSSAEGWLWYEEMNGSFIIEVDEALKKICRRTRLKVRQELSPKRFSVVPLFLATTPDFSRVMDFITLHQLQISSESIPFLYLSSNHVIS